MLRSLKCDGKAQGRVKFQLLTSKMQLEGRQSESVYQSRYNFKLEKWTMKTSAEKVPATKSIDSSFQRIDPKAIGIAVEGRIFNKA